ncbi:MAG: T9SS C-terminal target domain-containing protein [Bacteroidota bacterium]
MKPISLFLVLLLAQGVSAQFTTDAGIPLDDPSILDWGTAPLIERGLQQLDSTQLGPATIGTAADAAGPADLLVVSLGERGTATYTFDPAIGDGPGWDLAVFENGFASGNGFFLELAFVEVSSDGEHFVRFPATSLTSTTEQINTFGLLAPAQLNNLAGKYEGGLGTPFDLLELVDSSGLDIQHITHLRIVDVVGQLEVGDRDQEGRPINDPWPTPFASSGFDLDAVAFRYLGATSVAEANSPLESILIYPNPIVAGQSLNLQLSEGFYQEDLHFRWYDTRGKIVQEGPLRDHLRAPFTRGLYLLNLCSKTSNEIACLKVMVY